MNLKRRFDIALHLLNSLNYELRSIHPSLFRTKDLSRVSGVHKKALENAMAGKIQLSLENWAKVIRGLEELGVFDIRGGDISTLKGVKDIIPDMEDTPSQIIDLQESAEIDAEMEGL